jgi:hypothetical protein
VVRYPSLTCFAGLPHGCDIIWNFFAFGHGKGEVDGVGTLCKLEIRSEQMKPNAQRLQDVANIVAFMRSQFHRSHAVYASAKKVVNKHFWLVGASDVVRSRVPNVTTIPGSRSMHQVQVLHSYSFPSSSIDSLVLAKCNSACEFDREYELLISNSSPSVYEFQQCCKYR